MRRPTSGRSAWATCIFQRAAPPVSKVDVYYLVASLVGARRQLRLQAATHPAGAEGEGADGGLMGCRETSAICHRRQLAAAARRARPPRRRSVAAPPHTAPEVCLVSGSAGCGRRCWCEGVESRAKRRREVQAANRPKPQLPSARTGPSQPAFAPAILRAPSGLGRA